MMLRFVYTMMFVTLFSSYTTAKSTFCNSDSILNASNTDSVETIHTDSLTESILARAKSFLNKPYCYSGKGEKCFDCSGFVYKIFKEHGIELPPSSSQQAVCGNFISPETALPGDLIFFNGRRANCETIGHVGIITQVEAGEVYFIHASVKSGVIISRLSEPYYAARFMCIKNVLHELPSEMPETN